MKKPSDNPWLVLLVAGVSLVGVLLLLNYCSPFFNEVLR
jgi:hypothetical protein